MLWRNQRINKVSVVGLILGILIFFLIGNHVEKIISQNANSIQKQEASSNLSEDERKFISVVLADTEDVWKKIFQNSGFKYNKPKFVLFYEDLKSACEYERGVAGPFYCPKEKQLYLDLTFFQQLAHSTGPEGDFAAAYVIGHEVGHHVQNLLGYEKALHHKRSWVGNKERKKLILKFELQADCLSGVWAKQTQIAEEIMEVSDMEDAMNAASAIGEERLHSHVEDVIPDSFNHGTPKQRLEAFRSGFLMGDALNCLKLF